MLTLETEWWFVMRWVVARMEVFSRGALIECLQEVGSCSTDLLCDSVRCHGHEREVRRWSRALGRVTVEDSAP
jgi:hypothetical protein